MSNVFHDNCVVNWQPPDDDGGTEITGYIVEVNLDEDREMLIMIRMIMLVKKSLLPTKVRQSKSN